MSFKNALDFSGKQVLICGASDGIGYGVARAFLELGASVSVTGTRSQEDYDNDFNGMSFYSLNIQDHQAIVELAGKFDSLDVLVNCAGTVLYKKAEFEIDNFEKIVAVNLTGAMQLCTAFYPLLEASGGNIVVLDSIVSIRPALNNPAYSASKAGLANLAKSLAKKWGPKGVRVNTLAPGMVPTKITANQSSPEQLKQFAQTCPIPRMGKPEDIAGGVVYLASPLAAYVTGNHLVVDGGLTI